MVKRSTHGKNPGANDQPLTAKAVSEWLNRGAYLARLSLVPFAVQMPPFREKERRDPFATPPYVIASLAGLALLTRIARRPEPGRFDIATTRALQSQHSAGVAPFMSLISAPGFAPLQHVLTIGASMDFWAFGHKREAVFLMLTMGAGAIAGVIKIAVGRPRPADAFVKAHFSFKDNSFPSGHCAHYASFYGYLIYLTRRGMAPSRFRTSLLVLFTGLIVTVGPSRVYLGHHWFSDVIAGNLLGLTYASFLITAYETVFVRQSSAGALGQHVSSTEEQL